MFESTNVAVLGAGLMGCGIAQVFASHKVSVLLFDPFEQARDTALSKITNGIKSAINTVAGSLMISFASFSQTAKTRKKFMISPLKIWPSSAPVR